MLISFPIPKYLGFLEGFLYSFLILKETSLNMGKNDVSFSEHQAAPL